MAVGVGALGYHDSGRRQNLLSFSEDTSLPRGTDARDKIPLHFDLWAERPEELGQGTGRGHGKPGPPSPHPGEKMTRRLLPQTLRAPGTRVRAPAARAAPRASGR